MATRVGALFVELRASVARFGKDMDRAGQRIGRLGRSIGNVGRQMSVSITAPMAAVGVAAGKMAAEFSESLSRIEGLVGVSREQIDAWRGDLLKLAADTGKGPKELAEALFFVTSAGFRGQEALDILTSSAKAAAAGLGQTASVADAVTSAINAYGSENLSAARATDILVAAVREGKLSAESLTPVLGRVLPIASQLGVSFEEVAGAVAALSRKGLNAAESSTALRNILAKILKPGTDAAKVLGDLGIRIDDLRLFLRERGLLATLEQLKLRIGDNQEAMAKIFPDVEGLAGVFSLVGDSAADTKAIFDGVAGSTGALETAFGVAAREPAQKFRQAMTAVSTAMITLGDAVLPVVIPLLEKIPGIVEQIVTWFNALGPDVQEAAVLVAGAIGAGGPAIVAIGFFAQAIGALVAAAGPVGLFLAAAAAVVLAYRNWDEISAIVGRVVEAVRVWLVERFGAVVESVREQVDAVIGFFREMWQQVVGGSFVPDTVDEIEFQFGRLAKVMTRPAQVETGKVALAYRNLASDVSNSFANAIIQGDGLRGVLRGLLEDLTRFFSKKFIAGPLEGLFGNLFSGGLSLFGGGGGGLGPQFGGTGLEGLLAAGSFAGGGGFTVGGSGGTDSQLVAFRATPGEDVTVRTPAQQAGGGGDTFIIDAKGADAAGLARLEAMIRSINGSIEHRALAAVVGVRERDPSLFSPAGF